MMKKITQKHKQEQIYLAGRGNEQIHQVDYSRMQSGLTEKCENIEGSSGRKSYELNKDKKSPSYANKPETHRVRLLLDDLLKGNKSLFEVFEEAEVMSSEFKKNIKGFYSSKKYAKLRTAFAMIHQLHDSETMNYYSKRPKEFVDLISPRL